MEQLEEILNANISLCNKNNVIEIILGKVVSPSIFNTNIYSDSDLKTIFKVLKNPDFKYKKTINSHNLKRFYYHNTIIEAIPKNENQTEINQFSTKTELLSRIQFINNESGFDLEVNRVNYYDETSIIISPQFNHSIELEQFEITINNSFSIIIEKSLGYLCKLQIFKPVNSNIIMDIIKILSNS